jgi:hypothetical protein
MSVGLETPAPGPACELVPGMRKSMMLVPLVVVGGCSMNPSPVETGAFELDDVVHTTDDALRVVTRRRDVPLHEMPVASLLGIPMSGLADIAIDLVVPIRGGNRDYASTSGSITLGCATNCTLGDGVSNLHTRWTPAGGISFGKVTFDKVDIRAEITKGHMKVTRWRLESKDLTLDATLEIDLATELADSTLDGCVRFKPSAALAHRDPTTAAVIATTGGMLGPDGVYSIKIAGRIGERKILGKQCG